MASDLTRRELLASGSGLALLSAVRPRSWAIARGVLEVAYAGSMGSLMEGRLKSTAANSLGLDLHGRAQGSNALAQLIVGGSIQPDVFISVTPGPMLTILRSGKADAARPIARTKMVIAYTPRSRFASQFDRAAIGKSNWWEILEQPGLRFGRTDPVTDPQGRNIIFALMLAAKFYKQPDLVVRILGPAINDKQIFTEPTVQARLQSGELDAASAYKIQPGSFNLPYIELPEEINLSGENIQADHPDIALDLGGKTFRPEPLIFYAAVLKPAPHPREAAAFADWLTSDEAQRLMRTYNYDPPGPASGLRA